MSTFVWVVSRHAWSSEHDEMQGLFVYWLVEDEEWGDHFVNHGKRDGEVSDPVC